MHGKKGAGRIVSEDCKTYEERATEKLIALKNEAEKAVEKAAKQKVKAAADAVPAPAVGNGSSTGGGEGTEKQAAPAPTDGNGSSTDEVLLGEGTEVAKRAGQVEGGVFGGVKSAAKKAGGAAVGVANAAGDVAANVAKAAGGNVSRMTTKERQTAREKAVEALMHHKLNDDGKKWNEQRKKEFQEKLEKNKNVVYRLVKFDGPRNFNEEWVNEDKLQTMVRSFPRLDSRSLAVDG